MEQSTDDMMGGVMGQFEPAPISPNQPRIQPADLNSGRGPALTKYMHLTVSNKSGRDRPLSIYEPRHDPFY